MQRRRRGPIELQQRRREPIELQQRLWRPIEQWRRLKPSGWLQRRELLELSQGRGRLWHD